MTDRQMSNQSLVRLSDADYEVAPGEPDVRGWEVCLGNDRKIGEVDDLIIDPSAGKVRYLDVDLDRDALNLENDRHVLVPISGAQLDTEEEEVLLRGMSQQALLQLPEYNGEDFGATYDQSFRSHLGEDRHDGEREQQRITRSAEELRIGKRAEQKGEVRVSKHIESEHVTRNVPLRSEEVHVERRPVERAVGSAVDMRNDEIRVPITEEEAVVEKRPVVKEEIVITREPRMTERTVEADVRREEVDIKPSSGNVRVNDDMKGRRGE
jgi:uncharacterized protein (TIGR02271 family)